MAQVTVCDFCSKHPARTVQVPVGRSFDGVEDSTDYQCKDVCFDHLMMLTRCALAKLSPSDRITVLTRPEEPRW